MVKHPFPPDDSSVGYARGTTVSREWDQAQTFAAMEIASDVAKNLGRLADFKEDSPDRTERIQKFCHRFAERAFRRPLTEEQKQSIVEQYFAGEAAPDAAAKRVVLLVLMSPRFLYLDADAQQDDYSVASRLSFGLWDSLPDTAAPGGSRERTTAHVRTGFGARPPDAARRPYESQDEKLPASLAQH